jgi:hypothetical protein
LVRRAQVYGQVTWALYQKHPWLLREGKGFFGRLTEADFARIQAVVEEKRAAVASAVAGLQGLDNIDFLPMLSGHGPEGGKGQDVLGLLRQVVPMVFWHYFYQSFLGAWRESQLEGEAAVSAASRTGAMP